MCVCLIKTNECDVCFYSFIYRMKVLAFPVSYDIVQLKRIVDHIRSIRTRIVHFQISRMTLLFKREMRYRIR